MKGEFAVSISDIDNAAHLPFPVCSAIGGIVDYRAVKVPCRRTAVIKMIGRYTAENPFIFPGKSSQSGLRIRAPLIGHPD